MGDLSLVEETLKRISSYKGILGSVIINGDGIPVRHGQPAFDGNPFFMGQSLQAERIAAGHAAQVDLQRGRDAAVCGARLAPDDKGGRTSAQHLQGYALACREAYACTCRRRSQRRKVHASEANLAVLHRLRKQ